MASKTSEKGSYFSSQRHEDSDLSSLRTQNEGNFCMIDLRSNDGINMQSIKKEESANNAAQECPRNFNSKFLSVRGLNEKSSLVSQNSSQSLPLISVKAITSRRSGIRRIHEERSRIEIVSHVFGNRKGEFERNCRFYGILDSSSSFSHEQTTLSEKEVIYNNLNQPIQSKNLFTTGGAPTFKLQDSKISNLNVLHSFQDNLREQQDFLLKNSLNQNIKRNNNSSPIYNYAQNESVQIPIIPQSHANPSKLSGKSRMQNLDSFNGVFKNVKVNSDSENCPVYSIQQNLAEPKIANIEQQTRVFAELSDLIINPQKMHETLTSNSMTILQQCASLTQAGMTHFTFSRLLADFNALSSSTLETSSLEQIIDEDVHTPIFHELDTHIHKQSPNKITLSQSQHKAISTSSTCSFQAEISPTLENFKKENLFQNISPYLNDENKHSSEIKSSQNHGKSFIDQCKSVFNFKPLSSSQLSQFRFAQYKKKNQSGTDQPGNVSKFGKYHNYNKLFMYNILNMFQPNNLISLGVPEHISKELQLLISRIKNSAKNNYKVEGKYAFDYFSHAHYNILFLSITKENLPSLAAQSEFVDLYQTCFNIDIRIPLSSMTLAYINIIKLFCYQIFLDCICEESIHTDNSMTQENLKNLYTLKVIKGIKKLSQGMIIKRF